MQNGRRIADRLRRAISGPMWHGPAVRELLVGVSHTQAASKPLRSAHSIWELVLHITAWANIARLRVHGEALDEPTATADWPRLPVRVTAAEWAEAIAQLTMSHETVANTAALLPDETLDRCVGTTTETVGAMLDGVIEHTSYHGGQIVLLKRAL